MQTHATVSEPTLDYYQWLGVARGATPAEIKRAYRRQALRCHPDHNPGDAVAEAAFKRIHRAYEVLSDAALRALRPVR